MCYSIQWQSLGNLLSGANGIHARIPRIRKLSKSPTQKISSLYYSNLVVLLRIRREKEKRFLKTENLNSIYYG